MKMRQFALGLGLFSAPLAAQDAQEITLPNPDFEQTGEAGNVPGWLGNSIPEGAYRFVHAGRDEAADTRFARLESVQGVEEGSFGTIMQAVDPEGLRGRRVRLTARVRVAEGGSGHLGLWLRVDRPANARGFFDNMMDRPIRSREWAEYTIEGDIAFDAVHVLIGLVMSGAGAAEFDSVTLTDIGPAVEEAEAPGPQVRKPRIGPPRDTAISRRSGACFRLSAVMGARCVTRMSSPSRKEK